MLTKLKKMYAGIFLQERRANNTNLPSVASKKQKPDHRLLYHRDFKVSQQRKCQEPEHEFWIN